MMVLKFFIRLKVWGYLSYLYPDTLVLLISGMIRFLNCQKNTRQCPLIVGDMVVQKNHIHLKAIVFRSMLKI
ncbi:hypothetical protein ENTCAN_06366 [Enterobacter cancerogenus ATCC 35316]|nr:hypothetical protein ENTCAN_06366 [Enterobacter cancerogenus ATCC 35316]